MKKNDLNFRNEAMFMLKAVFLSFLIFSIPAQSMQVGKELTERIARLNVSLRQKFSPHRSLPQAKFFSNTTRKNVQTYTNPTYDAAFKWVLSDNNIRPSFFNAFIPGLNIQTSERLDDHMNPIEKLQTLREFIHKETTLATIKNLSGSDAHFMKLTKSGKKEYKKDEKATAFLIEMVARFDEIKMSFPKLRYDGTMDFVCQLDSGGYALVEMQVIPQNYWDRRALAYVAAFYGNQLSRGREWKDIRKVIGLNILGGGKDDKVHWSDTPGHFMRHYKFEDQLNGKNRFIDGIELIQYSIMQAPTVTNREKQDWFTFFKDARYMSEDDVKSRIKTPAVLQAFERAKISKLPQDVQTAYEAEDKEYDRYSQHTAEQVIKGKEETANLVARNLLNDGMSIEAVARNTGLSREQIEKNNKT